MPVTVRVHRERIVIWRNTDCLADHRRAADGAHQRVVVPEHFAPLFGKKPRAQVMLQRQALLELGGNAARFVGEVSRRRRDHLAQEITAIYALYERFGESSLLSAMAKAESVGIYGADYLKLLLQAPSSEDVADTRLPDLPSQSEVDRELRSYEQWVVGATPIGADEQLLGVARW